MTCAPYHRRQSGVALIEVLVTLLILMLGLLGLAGVSSRANMTELESFQRIRALQLAQDMASRLDANRKVASCYSNGQTGVELGTGKGNTSVPACTTGSDQEKAQVAADLTSWDNQIKGEAETLGTDKVGAMIGAIGCITLDNPANNTYAFYNGKTEAAGSGYPRWLRPAVHVGSGDPAAKARASGLEERHRQVQGRLFG